MHAVVITVTIDESTADPDSTMIQDQIIPNLRQIPGFVAGYWLEPTGGKALSVVFFESEEVARQTADNMGVTPGASPAPGVTFETVEFTGVAVSS
jgi:hypothetical protein